MAMATTTENAITSAPSPRTLARRIAAREATARIGQRARKVSINGCEVYALPAADVLGPLLGTSASHVVFDVARDWAGVRYNRLLSEVAIKTSRLRAVAKALASRGPVFCFVRPGHDGHPTVLGFRWAGGRGGLNFLPDADYRAKPWKYADIARIVIDGTPRTQSTALATVHPIRPEVIEAEFEPSDEVDDTWTLALGPAPAPIGLLPAAPEQECLWFGPEDIHVSLDDGLAPVSAPRVRAVQAPRKAARKAPRPRKVARVAKPAKRTPVRVVLPELDTLPPRQCCAGCR
jgi:hypothetical protein